MEKKKISVKSNKKNKKEIRELLKNLKLKENNGESILEENIENTENIINAKNFENFIQPSASSSESFTPVLRRGRQRAEETLEQQTAEIPTPKRAEEEQRRELDYVVKYSQPNYNSAESDELARMRGRHIVVDRAQRVDVNRPVFDTFRKQDQDIVVNPMLREMQGTASNTERDYLAKAQKIEKEREQSPFEERERKYKGKPI